MRAVVWVEGWQFQCCGDPFEPGSRVTWYLEEPDAEWLAPVLGPGARTVTHREEHHHAEAPGTPRTWVHVRSVRAVSCRYASRPGEDPRAHHPVAGTAVLTPVDRADGWEPETDELSFVGYLVEADIQPS